MLSPPVGFVFPVAFRFCEWGKIADALRVNLQHAMNVSYVVVPKFNKFNSPLKLLIQTLVS